MPTAPPKPGRHISNAVAAQHSKTTVCETPGPNGSTATAHRSASTGRLRPRRRQANPDCTVTENG